MRPVTGITCALLILVVTSAFVGPVLRSQKNPPASDDVQRGRYLVEEVAECGECHTPRDENNQIDHSRWLQGATIWIRPVRAMPNWGEFAPPLAGLPSFTTDQAEHVLEAGEGVVGKPIQPPMHTYHMSHSDAQAIVAYLKSLPAPRVQR